MEEISKLLVRYNNLKAQYDTFKKNMEEVETAFSKNTSLDSLLKTKDSFENGIRLIGQCKILYTKYPEDVYQVINGAFYRISDAFIDRQTFIAELTPIKNVFDEHLKSLAKALNDIEIALNNAYDAFMNEKEQNGSISTLEMNILSTDSIKEIFMEFLINN